MKTLSDVHEQFAEFFEPASMKPYAYLVSKKLSEGHICIPVRQIAAGELPECYRELVTDKDNVQQQPLVARAGDAKQPFILHNGYLYLQRYFNYETVILNRIGEFVATGTPAKKESIQMTGKHKRFIEDLFTSKNSRESTTAVTDWQAVAGISAAVNDFTIITGGPGTGKTTTVARVLAILLTINPALKAALAAPTGKAASRLGESLKNAQLAVDNNIAEKLQAIETFTVQRLLKPLPDSLYFKHNNTNPLNYDVVIVDESSMLDVALFAKLLDAIGAQTKLILLGDKDQLASVEAGSLFGDLCLAQDKLNLFSKESAAFINSFISYPAKKIGENSISPATGHPLFEHVVELRHSHRYNSEKGIGQFSKAVIQNDQNVIKQFLANKDDQVLFDTLYSDAALQKFVNGYEDFIHEKNIQAALKKLNKLRVLCAIKDGERGLDSVNRKIEKYLAQKRLLQITGSFYENRPLIITENYYELDLFNGDVGIVRADEAANGALKAWFEIDGKLRSYSPAYISKCETVFAMTIHKSQGSEFDNVMVILPDSPDVPILTRELLYTAVTRARSMVLVQGSEEVVLQSALAFVKRTSGIRERFKEYTRNN